MLTLTDANYGTPLHVRPEHIAAVTIGAETTYREGKIPDGTFRYTMIYTTGGFSSDGQRVARGGDGIDAEVTQPPHRRWRKEMSR